MKTAIVDIVQGFKRIGLSTSLAWEDLKDRYRRSVLGLIWIVLAFLGFILIKSLIFTSLFEGDGYDYFSHLVIGFAIFGFISASIPGGADVFALNKVWILSTDLPYTVYVNMLVIRSMIELLIVAVAAIICVLWLGRVTPGHLWTLFPALLLYYMTAMGLCFLFGPIGTRYRDLVYFLQSITRMLFFATPIVWVATPDTTRGIVGMYNPLTYFLDILRMPIIEGKVSLLAWGISGGVCLGIWIFGLIVFSATKRRIALWL